MQNRRVFVEQCQRKSNLFFHFKRKPLQFWKKLANKIALKRGLIPVPKVALNLQPT
jgi:hypothetical protein